MKYARLLLFIGWGIQGVAWFLPTITGIMGGSIGPTLPGYQAFLFAVVGVSHPADFSAWYWAVLNDLGALSAVLMVLGSPWLLKQRCSRFRFTSGVIALVAFVSNSHWYLSSLIDKELTLGVGYFCWWFSFLILGIGLIWFSKEGATPRLAKIPAAERAQGQA